MRRKRKLQEVPKQSTLSVTYLGHRRRADLSKSNLNHSDNIVNLKIKGQNEKEIPVYLKSKRVGTQEAQIQAETQIEFD